jgi:hypothetical protein
MDKTGPSYIHIDTYSERRRMQRAQTTRESVGGAKCRGKPRPLLIRGSINDPRLTDFINPLNLVIQAAVKIVLTTV